MAISDDLVQEVCLETEDPGSSPCHSYEILDESFDDQGTGVIKPLSQNEFDKSVKNLEDESGEREESEVTKNSAKEAKEQHTEMELQDNEETTQLIENEEETEAVKILGKLIKEVVTDLVEEVSWEEAGGDKKLLEDLCLWPKLHAALRELKLKGSVSGVAMGQLVPDPLKTRAGAAKAVHLLNQDKIIQKSLQESKDVCDYIGKGCEENVYKKKDIEAVKNIRVVLDLKTQLKHVKDEGAVGAAQVSMKEFLRAAHYIDPKMEVKCQPGELRQQFQLFQHRLEEVGELQGSDSLSSMDIIILMLNTAGRRFVGVEAVMDVICQACTYMGTESQVEGWISVLEHHSSKQRGLTEDRIHDEMMVACNGPPVQHCLAVVQEAMRDYWQKHKEWHFIRRSEDIKSYMVSKSVDSLRKTMCYNPMML